MKHLGNYTMGSTVRCYFNTHKANGMPATLSGLTTIAVYSDSSTESTAGITLYVNYDGLTGYNCVVIDLSADSSFYTYEKDYSIVIKTGAVDGISVAGTEVGCFSILYRYASVNAIGSNAISNASFADGALSWSKFASDYSTNLVSNIWSATTRTLTSFGSLVSNVVSGVWDAGTRTLTSIADSAGVTTLLSRVIGTIAAGTHYPQSGDSYARIGANGSGLTSLGDSRLANLDATVSSRLASASYTAPPSTSDIVTALNASTVDGTLTELQAKRLILAVLAGKASVGTGTVAFKRADGTTTALTVEHDQNGNRTVITLGSL